MVSLISTHLSISNSSATDDPNRARELVLEAITKHAKQSEGRATTAKGVFTPIENNSKYNYTISFNNNGSGSVKGVDPVDPNRRISETILVNETLYVPVTEETLNADIAKALISAGHKEPYSWIANQVKGSKLVAYSGHLNHYMRATGIFEALDGSNTVKTKKIGQVTIYTIDYTINGDPTKIPGPEVTDFPDQPTDIDPNGFTIIEQRGLLVITTENGIFKSAERSIIKNNISKTVARIAVSAVKNFTIKTPTGRVLKFETLDMVMREAAKSGLNANSGEKLLVTTARNVFREAFAISMFAKAKKIEASHLEQAVKNVKRLENGVTAKRIGTSTELTTQSNGIIYKVCMWQSQSISPPPIIKRGSCAKNNKKE